MLEPALLGLLDRRVRRIHHGQREPARHVRGRRLAARAAVALAEAALRLLLARELLGLVPSPNRVQRGEQTPRRPAHEVRVDQVQHYKPRGDAEGGENTC